MNINYDNDGSAHYGANLTIWFFRWDTHARLNCYLLTFMCPGLFQNHHAVVDDFGALVIVPPFLSTNLEFDHV